MVLLSNNKCSDIHAEFLKQDDWPGVCNGDQQRLHKHGAEERGGGQDVGRGLQELSAKKQKQNKV